MTLQTRCIRTYILAIELQSRCAECTPSTYVWSVEPRKQWCRALAPTTHFIDKGNHFCYSLTDRDILATEVNSNRTPPNTPQPLSRTGRIPLHVVPRFVNTEILIHIDAQ